MRAVAHGRHCHLLADIPGINDEWNVLAALLQQIQRFQGPETRPRMAGDDDVPMGLLQCSPHPRNTIRLLIRQVVSGARKFRAQQTRIVFRILDNQYSHIGARCIAYASARAATVSVSAVPRKTLVPAESFLQDGPARLMPRPTRLHRRPKRVSTERSCCPA